MKINSLRFYKTITIILFVLNILLICIDYNLLKNKNIYKNTITVLSAKPNHETIRLGYSDALEVLRQDKNMEIKGISKSSEEGSTIKFEVKYNGSIQELYNSILKIKENKNFYSIENINITSKDNVNKEICLSMLFYIST